MTQAELSHYGVKGMKWGVRRSEAQLEKAARKERSDKNYSAKQRANDKQEFSRHGVKRIAKRVGKGQSVTQARNREAGREIVDGLIAAGAFAGLSMALGNPTIANGLATRIVSTAQTADAGLRDRVNRQNAEKVAAGARATAAIFSDSRGLTDINTISLNPSEYSRTR